MAWERALAARRRGDHRGAAAALGEIVWRHSSSPLAPLAAFELGRLRMDVLKDRRGAIKGLEVALARGRKLPYHEHALARLVRLHQQLGDAAKCTARRAAYLRRYPKGAHAASLSRLSCR